MVRERDYYIDAVKGVAALSIIFIHTVHLSGVQYVPDLFRGLALFIDVPIFFLASGLTSSGNIERSLKRLIKLQVSYLLFISIVHLLEFMGSGHFVFSDYLHCIFHQEYPHLPLFHAATYAMWYMQIYFLVAFIGLLVIRFLHKKEIVILLGILFAGIVSTSYIFLPFKLPFVFFYLFIFLTGYLLKDLKIDLRLIVVSLGVVAVSLAYLLYEQGLEFFTALQGYKFPPALPYLIASAFSLVTVLALRFRLKVKESNGLVYLGQNALFLYFAQGVGSSILFLLVDYMLEYQPVNPYLMMMLMYLANIVMSLVIMIIFKQLDKYMWIGIGKVRKVLA